MNLKDAYLRVTAETDEQFEASLEKADLVYIDAAFFAPEAYEAAVRKAHEAGKLCGLRLPYIWRNRAEEYFDRCKAKLKAAGFDIYLFRNTESLLYFAENGLLSETAFAADSSIYTFNNEAVAELTELVPEGSRERFTGFAMPLELNQRELERLGAEVSVSGLARELTVYGRAHMMVSAQCINKTVTGCDRKEKLLMLKDRKQAEMPVKNCCRFCFNQIYNSVPTVLFDMCDVLKRIPHDCVRYDFTVERGKEVQRILDGRLPANGAYTRGHLKRGV